ncbi:unannotated protein [freshwater metagenome]|uniref:[acyl-carrier-protein] S-malonyltransferase n=1 Tax=freshwater metagenome TaxID=449393 RepID=A0A6J7BVQ5_9ZZZZ
MLVVVAPGQGAQTPGFLTPWLEVPGFEDRLRWLSAVSGVDLITHGTESDADTIRDTAVAQPLIVGAGLVTLLSLFPHPAEAYGKVAAGAGHSVGEITAAVGAGVINAEQAMVFVRERGKAMAIASAVTPTGMTAVLGGERDEIVAAAEKYGLTAANENGAGQIVVAGTLEQLDAFAADPPARARLRPLQVAGAFHTEHMVPAVAQLASYARSISVHDPRTRLISNADGTIVHNGREVLARLVRQVSSPVRWDLCMSTMADLGVTAMLELPPFGCPHRAGQARPPRNRDPRDHHTGRPPGGMGSHRTARDPHPHVTGTHLAPARGSGQGHLPTGKRSRRRRQTRGGCPDRIRGQPAR